MVFTEGNTCAKDAADKKRADEKLAADNEQLKREKRIAENHIRRMQNELNSRPPARISNKRVYTDKSTIEFNEQTKQKFIDDNMYELQSLLEYVDKHKRRQARGTYIALWTECRDEFEQWTIAETGNRWLVQAVALKKSTYQNGPMVEARPSEDFVDITFTHKGYLRHMVGPTGESIVEKGVAPPSMDILMTVRVHRFELGL